MLYEVITFAWVYRYVLNIQDKTAVTLGDELDFVDAYIFLQKIRFPNAFEVDIDISGECNSHYIVPLSVQMMLENAIKHNVVSQEQETAGVGRAAKRSWFSRKPALCRAAAAAPPRNNFV